MSVDLFDPANRSRDSFGWYPLTNFGSPWGDHSLVSSDVGLGTMIGFCYILHMRRRCNNEHKWLTVNIFAPFRGKNIIVSLSES